jgi:hypothetical protein
VCCLQVLGNMKGVIAAAISIALFKNPVTAKGMLGYFITVCGVVAYSEVGAGQQWAAVTTTHVGSLLGCMRLMPFKVVLLHCEFPCASGC